MKLAPTVSEGCSGIVLRTIPVLVKHHGNHHLQNTEIQCTYSSVLLV